MQLRVLSFLGAPVLMATLCFGQAADPVPVNGIQFVLKAFDSHSVVAIGDQHGMQELHDFIRSVIQTPAFSQKANEIVVEWGNSLYQDVADRYMVGGEMMPQEIVQGIWRNTTQSVVPLSGNYPVWDSPVYQRFFETVRAVNLELAPPQRIRVVLADPPVNWSAVKTAGDLDAWLIQRDASFKAAVDQVLARQHRALVLIGAGHLFRSDSQPNLLASIEKEHPGATYLIVCHAGFGFQNAALEPAISSWLPNSIAEVRGTNLGALPASAVTGTGNAMFGPGIPPPDPFAALRVENILDAYLFVGTRDSLHEWKPYAYIYRDDRYWRELNRRHQAQFAQPFDPAGPGWDNRTRLFDTPLDAVPMMVQ